MPTTKTTTLVNNKKNSFEQTCLDFIELDQEQDECERKNDYVCILLHFWKQECLRLILRT